MKIGTRWSKIKKLAENLICDSLRGRVEYRMTSYNRTHDHTGRGYITYDKKEIFNACFLKAEVTKYSRAKQLCVENHCEDYNDPEQQAGYYAAWRQTEFEAEQQGVYENGDYWLALCSYINQPFEESLTSENNLVRAFAMLDKRLGKRRLREITPEQVSHPLVRMMYNIRCNADGIALEKTS